MALSAFPMAIAWFLTCNGTIRSRLGPSAAGVGAVVVGSSGLGLGPNGSAPSVDAAAMPDVSTNAGLSPENTATATAAPAARNTTTGMRRRGSFMARRVTSDLRYQQRRERMHASVSRVGGQSADIERTDECLGEKSSVGLGDAVVSVQPTIRGCNVESSNQNRGAERRAQLWGGAQGIAVRTLRWSSSG